MESPDKSSQEITKFKNKPYKHQVECLNKHGRDEYFALLAEQGTGKAQPLDSKVLTDEGWKEIGNLKIGDLIFASSGEQTKVKAIYPQGEKDVYKITFHDGSTAESCKEHLWLSSNVKERAVFKKGKSESKYSVKPLEEIMKKIKDNSGINVNYIPLNSKINFSRKETELDPYFLGVLIGDGHLRGAVKFKNSEEFILEKIKKHLPENLKISSSNNEHRLEGDINNQYKDELEKLGLMGKLSFEKFIPAKYKFNCQEISLSVLQGLMDTDGTVEGGVPVFSTTSKQLAEDVAEITRSFGGIARINERKNCGHFKDGEKIPTRNGFVVRLILPNGLCPFSLPRKKILFKENKKYSPKHKIITKIEFSRKTECVCISLEHESKLYITDGHSVTHNTFIIINNLADLWSSGDCDGALILAPNGVHSNWTIIEIPKHMPDYVRMETVCWKTGMGKRETEAFQSIYKGSDSSKLRIMAMNWDALRTDKGFEEAKRFLNSCLRPMIVADESDTVKNPQAGVTKSLMKLKKMSAWRRIMTGTMINGSPFDAFSQYMFLDDHILQTTSYYAFKAEYAQLLTENHGLIQNIVNKKVKMSDGDKTLLYQKCNYVYDLMSKNGREELTLKAYNLIQGVETSDLETIVKTNQELRSSFSDKSSPRKTLCLQAMAKIDEIIARHQRSIANAFDAKRLPQIVDKNKDGTPKYKNLDKLSRLIAPYSFRVLKKDCLDLPEKIYKTVVFTLTREQQEIYTKAKEEFRLVFESQESAVSKLTAFSKLAQITSGYFIHPETKDVVRIKGDNPKLELMAERAKAIVAEGAKVIIWARYRMEIDDIIERLTKDGITSVRYDGSVSADDRKIAINEFQNGEVQAFVSNQQAGGTGITLTAAECVIYFSNNFKLRDRLQSEDRNHRIGQTKNVVYYNIVAEGTIDEYVIKCLENKTDVAQTIVDKGIKKFSEFGF